MWGDFHDSAWHNAIDMRLICLFALLACAAAAQSVDGVTISVTRQVNAAPDQAEFTAVFTVALDTTQQQVIQALHDLGVSEPLVVTAVAITSNSYSYPPVDTSQLYFQVTFTSAPAAMKDIAKKLDAFRAAPPAGFTTLQFGAALTTSQAAIDAAHQTALPLILADARTKAQALASAAGVKLGPITGVIGVFVRRRRSGSDFHRVRCAGEHRQLIFIGKSVYFQRDR